jgi:large subunit ribosomal protein L9
VKVVLRADVSRLGNKGDVLDVSDGYARNYLVPRGLALKASPGVEAQATAMRRSRDIRDAQERAAAEEVARALVSQVVRVAARAGGGGRLFGSVTTTDVVDAVREQTGIELDRRKLHLDEPIREVGSFRVTARLHADVEFPITVEVGPGL